MLQPNMICNGESIGRDAGGHAHDAGSNDDVFNGCSWASLALRVKEFEERIPWTALRDGHGMWDWEVLRPAWQRLLSARPLDARIIVSTYRLLRARVKCRAPD